ncbi:chitin synthase [Mucor mucedo]|uniref:chitin synthase n=1 Tax=Mucor mucedo TaxID=29922 RepID=UPI00222087D6|nr:chitin synthase [Mucor mucedo]KAI7891847.1 chitin synthase [Mucor mucedo]
MQEDSRTDLVSLYNVGGSVPTEDTISNLLANRYKRNLPYTQLGYSNLVVVNPYQHLELLNDATLKSYAEIGYKDLSEGKQSLQPHVYELATRVYFHMRRTGEDQSVILSGITGSGKSTTRTHFLCELLQLSTHNKRETKLSSQIQNALVIIEAFGHARTTQNTSASKFGMFQEVQFNERGRILGTKTMAYQFDKSRVTQVPQHERTYHVFYSLMAGTSIDEKNALHINFKPEYFNYLSQSNCISTPDWNDEIRFADLKSALKLCGFKAKTVTQIFQLLAAILHIGNLQFMEGTETLAQEACIVKNTDVLDIVAVMLGVSPSKLEMCLTYKLKLIGKEVCTMFLNPQAASEQRDDLARALYNVLFLWIVESINRKVCYTGTEQPTNVVGIMDQFGFQNFSVNTFEEFCVNFANERMHHFLVNENFGNDQGIHAIMLRDGVPLPTVKVTDNSACLELLIGKDKKQLIEDAVSGAEKKEKLNKSSSLGLTGVVGLMDRDTARLQSGVSDATNANFLATLQRQFSSHPSLSRGSQTYSFGINHFSGTVHYSVDNFLEKNLDDLSPDFVNMLRESSSNSFLSGLFQGTAMATESHPKDDRTIVKAQLSRKPTRAPSMRRKPTKRRPNAAGATTATGESNPIPEDNNSKEMQIKKAEEAYENMEQMTVVDQLYITLRDITFSMADTKIYNIIHIRPNDSQSPEYDHNRVRSQIRAFLLPDLVIRHQYEYANFYTVDEFEEHYSGFLTSLNMTGSTAKERIQQACVAMHWSPQAVYVGHEMVWLNYQVWKQLEDGLRSLEKEDRARAKGLLPPATEGGDASQGPISEASYDAQGQRMLAPYGYAQQMNDPYLHSPDHGFEDNASYAYSEDKREADGSQWGEESEWGMNVLSEGFGPNMDMSKMIEDVQVPQIENIEEVPITSVRRWWVRFVWLCTFWIPSFCLSLCGKMKRSDIQMAWREKVTLCMVIGIISGIILFVIVGLGEVICPGTKNMYSTVNVQQHNTEVDNYISFRGVVYDITKFAKSNHGVTGLIASPDGMTILAGMDLTGSIAPPLTAACAGLVTSAAIKIQYNYTVNLASTFLHYSGDQYDPSAPIAMKADNWYTAVFMKRMNEQKKGILVHSLANIAADAEGWGRSAMAIGNKVYDITDYLTTITQLGDNYKFLPDELTALFSKYKGADAQSFWADAMAPNSAEVQQESMNCLNNFFYIGDVDPRDTPACMFTNYMLLTAAVLMCFVVLVKFLAALQFGSAPTPEDHDKFVICQVPCYTEDEDSLKKTIDSLTVMKYDDKRKLLFIIADGMVMGSGNDRPTPRIVLDILGYDTKNDPEPLMFKSVGEGAKQLNYGKVYSGLYECEGHVVPYIVVAKVGKASERAKPGNRGKRDSQMICMSFLNRVHFDGEMTPMELEMYHQIKNVIGVNPSFYEYVLMVDSDTEVMPQSLSYLISSMLHDGRIMGICGETALSNENESWTTMIQVYEYFISHYLAKAFESLFGSVTCLPGCFCMYRVRTPVKNEPLIISPLVVHAYAENHVDTLHKKNLLSLGEDRYLTTLMMKYFPQYKMKFTPYAMCRTVAPDKWRVLLSQRRRWINSTIHNLAEVVLLPDLCGFCCFSMRFVVLLDLFGTLSLPVSFAYLIYLIYVMAAHAGPFPTLAMGMLAGLYALQILIFILKRQWQHIGWMFFYILALPIYSFFLPLYSFWHMDDFSWGNTRVVVGESQRKIIVTDEEKFDEKMIPLKKWSVYEQELWEMGSQGTRDTGMSGNTYNSYNAGVPPGYDNRSQYSSTSGNGGDYDYYRDGKKNEKPRSRAAYAHTTGTGSVIGSEYGGHNGGMNQQTMMSEYNRSMMGTPPPGMQMRPMSYASSANPDYMSQIQPMMMDPAYGMMQSDMHGAGGGPGMYNNTPSHMSGTFDHMGAPSPAFGSRARNASYDRGSNLSATNLLGQHISVPPMIPAGFPTDDEILSEIKNILATANLMSITKKQVREQLSDMFGFDMNFKKDFINSSIEYILQGRL